MASDIQRLEARLTLLEDQLAIYQVINGYGYAVDGLNAEAVGACYVENGVYAVGDIGNIDGRDAIEAITRDAGHRALVAGGCAHMSTVPHVVIDGDQAVATCHTMVALHRDDGFVIGRLSASRLSLARQQDGGWKIVHRQNYLLNGDPAASALLGELKTGPTHA
ncbi:nuclear transport factor 2 family protein [Sphingomonas natans]|nr:nuclear transport factor 2 family protein [Sphingomonas sp. BIUV-7]